MKNTKTVQTVRNLKPSIILYLEKQIPASTETVFRDFMKAGLYNSTFMEIEIGKGSEKR